MRSYGKLIVCTRGSISHFISLIFAFSTSSRCLRVLFPATHSPSYKLIGLTCTQLLLLLGFNVDDNGPKPEGLTSYLSRSSSSSAGNHQGTQNFNELSIVWKLYYDLSPLLWSSGDDNYWIIMKRIGKHVFPKVSNRVFWFALVSHKLRCQMQRLWSCLIVPIWFFFLFGCYWSNKTERKVFTLAHLY